MSTGSFEEWQAELAEVRDPQTGRGCSELTAWDMQELADMVFELRSAARDYARISTHEYLQGPPTTEAQEMRVQRALEKELAADRRLWAWSYQLRNRSDDEWWDEVGQDLYEQQKLTERPAQHNPVVENEGRSL